jgi:hypothetical protein
VVEHFVDGRQVYTLGESSEILHVQTATLRQRVKRQQVSAAGWINGREPVYYPEDLGLENRS